MIDGMVNEDIKKTGKNVKSSEEAVNEMEKIIKSNKCNILWLAYQQGQIFERFKMNDNFIDMAKKFWISKSTTVFKISIVKFANKYLNDIKVRGVFLKKKDRKKIPVPPDKNFYYFCKSNITVINLILGSRNMIKVSKNMIL